MVSLSPSVILQIKDNSLILSICWPQDLFIFIIKPQKYLFSSPYLDTQFNPEPNLYACDPIGPKYTGNNYEL